VVQAAGRRVESDWTVTELVPLDHLTIEGSRFGADFRLTEEVEAIDPQRTKCTLRIEYSLPFGPFGRLASKLGVERLARQEAGDVLRNLARLLEAGDPSEAAAA
jgi:hypothetical protein